jgi:hypothetical protein
MVLLFPPLFYSLPFFLSLFLFRLWCVVPFCCSASLMLSFFKKKDDGIVALASKEATKQFKWRDLNCKFYCSIYHRLLTFDMQILFVSFTSSCFSNWLHEHSQYAPLYNTYSQFLHCWICSIIQYVATLLLTERKSPHFHFPGMRLTRSFLLGGISIAST